MAWCERCNRYFSSFRALQQHKDDSSNHWECNTCDRDFTTWYARHQHYANSPRHFYCQQCEELFDDQDDLEEHYHNEHHYCRFCKKFFNNERGLIEHYRQAHWYCEPCKKVFLHENGYQQHLRSNIHRPLTVPCPGRGCGRFFASQANLISHFESGTCPSGVTRQMINRGLIRLDRGRVITNPDRLITEGNGGLVTDTWATERSWDPELCAYVCYICQNGFKTLKALNAHLKSPAHNAKIYKCPPSLDGCLKEFVTLSALCQHIENEICGVRRFKSTMERLVDDFTSRMRITAN